VIIFDCNGVLVDGEQIAAEVAADELTRAGIAITPELVIRYFSGRRPADMLAMIEAVTRQKLPANLGATIAAATVKRLREELRAMPHAAPCAYLAARAEMRGIIFTSRTYPGQPGNHRTCEVLQLLFFRSRRAERQTGARSIAACSIADGRAGG
jgi:beta-phosphoglucomutase-like phosphatase (HAD superfamily)